MMNRALTAIGAVSAALVTTTFVVACSQTASPQHPAAGSAAKSPPASRTASPAATRARPASLVQVRAFGADPSKVGMDLYVPRSVRPHPAILLALAECEESGSDFYQFTEFARLADQYGFIVIYPSSAWSDGCWDVSSAAALRHDGGSDPVAFMSMITYVERTDHADPRRVYVTGASSGAMMTAVMLGDYPGVFKAGAIFMGVPFGCFAGPGPDVFDNACTSGEVRMSTQRWGDLVRAADPGYHGPRPRVQIWHGTADGTVTYADFGAEIRQWTNVFGVSQTPVATDHPRSGWTRAEYGAGKNDIDIEAYSILGADHVLPEPGMEAYAIHFFGLDHG